ncbi:YqcI/YcgG family protein [Cytobacillus oceanisediminis]|uniref:YqcI/YcgG family protein n=1 Tax=Cytobacillus oceanisediminis TaxID=665099 RepID=UPI0023DBA8D7|nr:YqcI/YcgG family protein [Cytobacillus oceanisediminis]MDF2036217.1 YqcI/YcgG family protein [Cytobacillus oceanisediminis]
MHSLEDWQQIAFDRFQTKMTDKERPFPCIPATIGFAKNQLRYGFADDPRDPASIQHTAAMLNEFSIHSRELGSYTSLIIFYNTRDDLSVEEYEQLFWEQLTGLSELDNAEWPNEIPKDPHDPLWEFCFHGEKYFVYCATPAHKNRQSRHFDTMMLAITPRWVLQEFMKKETLASRLKNQIRKRLQRYDSIAIHPDLNSYGADDNFEWKQYFLRDDDTTISKCPFHRLLKTSRNK